MPNAIKIGQERAEHIVALANTNDFLEHVADGSDYRADNTNGVVAIQLKFLFRDRDGREILTPHRRGQDEPFILIEETRYAPDGRLGVYNYDLVFPSRNIHYGYHHHIHNQRLYPHRQGFGVPGGHEPFPYVDLERDDVFWLLISKAFEIDDALNS